MKIGIMADSHDHRGYIRKAVELFNSENVEHVINPGEVCGWLTSKATIAILETSTNEVSIREL